VKGRSFPRTHAWELLLGAATALVAVLLALVATGVLVLPPPAPATVTIVGVDWTIEEGTTSLGYGWFGPNEINLTETDGLPFEVASGGAFVLVLALSNLDSVNHTIHSATAVPPFNVTGTNPALPRIVLSGEDDWFLRVSLDAPTVSSSQSCTIELTLDAVTALGSDGASVVPGTCTLGRSRRTERLGRRTPVRSALVPNRTCDRDQQSDCADRRDLDRAESPSADSDARRGRQVRREVLSEGDEPVHPVLKVPRDVADELVPAGGRG